MLKQGFLTTVAAVSLIAAAAIPARAEVSIMYMEAFAALVEPGIEAFEAETGETVNAIKLPGQGYDQRIALDLSAGTAADVQTRLKMGQSSNVFAVVKADGKLFSAFKETKVTLGGCGG